MKKLQNTTTTHLIRTLSEHGAITLYGSPGLVIARRAIEQVFSHAGCTIAFDPSSSPDLVDYLSVTTISSIEGASLGAGLGALIGLMFDCAAAGTALGAGLGLLAGASRGIRRVESGWRVRAVRDLNGAPTVTINALKPT